MQGFDALVAGGGIAGSTTAAALAAKGMSVLLCEAGLPSEKRLAGELMHPAAARDLESVGFGPVLRAAGAVPVYGFALFRSATDPGMLLSYSEIPGARPSGLALEHALMTRTLLAEVSRRPGVTLWEDARVVSADLARPTPLVRVRRGAEEVMVAARLVVSAEGRSSPLRRGAGITCVEDEPFRMVGWKVPEGRLPYPGYGHLFVGGPTPTLAYQVSQREVRVMFELPADGLDVPAELMRALPLPFREDVARAMEREPRQIAKVFGLRPTSFARAPMAVVGDAGGCVHPLTASGISYCTQDALRLAGVVAGRLDALPRALDAYSRGRAIGMHARTALGPALVDALCSRAPEMRLVRHGLFRYWTKSRRGRSASLGLLSTERATMGIMAREYAIVCAHALTGLTEGVVPARELVPALIGLARRSSGYVAHALQAARRA